MFPTHSMIPDMQCRIAIVLSLLSHEQISASNHNATERCHGNMFTITNTKETSIGKETKIEERACHV